MLTGESNHIAFLDECLGEAPAARLVTPEEGQQALGLLLDSIATILPSFEPETQSPLGLSRNTISYAVYLPTRPAPYTTSEGTEHQIRLMVSAPRLLHDNDIDASPWSTIYLQASYMWLGVEPAFSKIAELDQHGIFQVYDMRSTRDISIKTGSHEDLSGFIAACEYIKTHLET